eukprot:gene12558-7650_t
MSRLWQWYLKNLDARPIMTKTGMTLGLMAVADTGAQSTDGDHLPGMAINLDLQQHGAGSLQDRATPALNAANAAAAAAAAAAANKRRGSGISGARTIEDAGAGPAVMEPDSAAAISASAEPFEPFKVDWDRQRAMYAYAVGFQGWFGHWWFAALDRQARLRVPTQFIIPFKLVADQAVNATLSNVVYLSLIPWMEGRADTEWIHKKLRLDLFPTLLVDCAFWPVCMARAGEHPISVLVWSVFLSFVCHDDSLLRSFDKYNPFHHEKDIEFLAAAEHQQRTKLLVAKEDVGSVEGSVQGVAVLCFA